MLSGVDVERCHVLFLVSYASRTHAAEAKIFKFTSRVTEMITQGLLLGLTFAKEFFSRDTHILRAPITSLIYRDGVLACGAVFSKFFCSRIRA